MRQLHIHLIGNAHIDPVWLWDWREGLNEGITTVRTILDLMDEYPQMTFIRGESAVYRHIERYAPQIFERIQKACKEGRWDIVGGNIIQPDTNLPCTEALVQQFKRGKAYFSERFNFDVQAAWAADSFGHPAGLPDILHQCGLKYFAFTRPPHKVLPIDDAAFWWIGSGGSRILAYRPRQPWYGTERNNLTEVLDGVLKEAHGSQLSHVGCFYGLGNHGGGPTRRHLDDIQAWADRHPEIKVIHSGLHRLFHCIEADLQTLGDDAIPTHQGELGFALRGCYSSAARFKFQYRKAEASLLRAERTCVAIDHALSRPPTNFDEVWDGLLFNAFHDILPGTSIERAMDEQADWMGGILHSVRSLEFDALNALAIHADTTVLPPTQPDMPSGVPVLVFNPHDTPYQGPVEIEASLDYRPIHAYAGKPNEVPIQLLDPDRLPVSVQVIRTEHSAFENIPWRKRIVFQAQIPEKSWQVYEMKWLEGAEPVALPEGITPASCVKKDEISNGIFLVRPEKEKGMLHIARNGKSLFGASGLRVSVFEDPWGSWGGMEEEPESTTISTLREQWAIKAFTVLERGDHRASMWVRFAGKDERSWLDLTLAVVAGRDAVDVSARVMWNERSARLKLILPCGDHAVFDVPGGTVERGPMGEVPGGRWVKMIGKEQSIGFASNALYNFSCQDGTTSATVCRASRYASDAPMPSDTDCWRPAVDAGELKFKFFLTSGENDLAAMARELEQPLIVQAVPASPGRLGRRGTVS